MKITLILLFISFLCNCAQFVSGTDYNSVKQVKSFPKTNIYVIRSDKEDRYTLKNHWNHFIGSLEVFDDFEVIIVDSKKDIIVGKEKSILIEQSNSKKKLPEHILISIFTLYLIPIWFNDNHEIEITIKNLNNNKSYSTNLAYKTLTIFHFVTVFFLLNDDYNPFKIEKKLTRKAFYDAFSKLKDE